MQIEAWEKRLSELEAKKDLEVLELRLNKKRWVEDIEVLLQST